MTYPYDFEMEKSIITGLLDYPEVADRILSMFKPDDFYSDRCRDVLAVARKIRAEKKTVDLMIVHERLKPKYALSEINNITMDSLFVPGLLEHYAEILKEQVRERKMFELVDWALVCFKEKSAGNPLDVPALMKEIEGRIYDIRLNASTRPEDTASQLARYNADLCEQESQDRVYCESWPDLNEGILWQRKTLNAVAARPGGGKSSFLIHLFTMLAGQRNSGMYFSVEVKHKAFFDRMASCVSQIPKWRFRDRKATADERAQAITPLAEMLDRIAIRFKEHAITPESIAADLYRFRAEHDRLDFFIVDYLQIIDLSGYKFKKRYETLREAAEYLRDLADKLNCVCFIGVQVGRDYEKAQGRGGRTIMLSDFRESGDIENTVDTALGLNVLEPDPNTDRMGIQILKNREGVSGLMVGFDHDKVRNYWKDISVMKKKE